MSSLLNYHRLVPSSDLQKVIKDTNQTVHILASGSSITQVNMIKICQQPSIFVNGSIQLFADYQFNQPVAYVISDHRFIEHNVSLMMQYYNGQCPLFITQSVLENLQKFASDYLTAISDNIHLIHNFQKPINRNKTNFFEKIRKKLSHPNVNNQFIKLKQPNSSKKLIGVSTDIRHGFVEAGTVVFVATQLAYTMGFKSIYIHGMDLLNTHQPRFYENQKEQAPCKLDKAVTNRIVPSFDFLAEVYQQQDVKVYNGSPISKGIFDNLVFSDIFLIDKDIV
ncbi:hypothetical protein VH441_02770 [Psychrobacter sp. HD31]|uniref:hypothetical protein n=1 Tax=Psychrobacter sp. HD31 TaxID=3112003 RepID=UPI003DA2848D